MTQKIDQKIMHSQRAVTQPAHHWQTQAVGQHRMTTAAGAIYRITRGADTLYRVDLYPSATSLLSQLIARTKTIGQAKRQAEDHARPT